ncbi:guanine nucleotide-binding protein subunit beta-like protein 1 [Spea bombifrons]|uniref:guanine nucleotide-binding protein subunit beta-like protein 1 n=1 Tax=Spea bombifrons TaxID=233779 RepID=UPI00234925BE|nr:guanine nucleotide-binding protein subunit beta-like protein 1 [Spea bombifrons]XP_053327157.1 guanine nucleotide-binding protein subunit beta-like protein 1 [Spea bombifrons]
MMALPPPAPKFDLRGIGSEVNCLHFSCVAPDPCPPVLFSGVTNGLVHVWNLTTRRTLSVLDGHGGKSVYWVQALHNKDSLLSQGRDLQICTWNLAEGRNEVIDSLPLESVGFCKCSLVKTEPILLAMPGRENSEVQVLDLLSKKIVCSMNPKGDNRWGMAMCMKLWQPESGSSPLLLVGYEDGSVALWHVMEHKLLSRLTCHKEPVMSLDFDCKQGRGVSGSSDKILNVWSLDEQQNLKDYKSQVLINPGIADIVLRLDRKILATAGWDHRIRIFGWKKMKPLAVLQHHTATVHCVTFSDHIKPEDRLLAAGSKDHRISLWSIYP